MRKKAVYIAGPITGVPEYYKPFEEAMDELQAVGLIPLNPCWQPQGLSRDRYIRLGLAMLGCADAALFLPGWEQSRGCNLEMSHCDNTNTPTVTLQSMSDLRLAAKLLVDLLEEGDEL